MQADVLDQRADVGLGALEEELPAGHAQAPREHREIEHERRIREGEAGEIDDDIGRRADGLREGLAAQGLRRPILVAATTEQGWVFVVGDDADNLSQSGRERLVRIAVMATLEEIEEALTNVIDPELGLDFVELGLIYGIQQDAGNVHVTFTLTTPACPIGPQITEQIEEFVAPLEGVASVQSSMTFDPPWSPEKMSEDAKFALGF